MSGRGRYQRGNILGDLYYSDPKEFVAPPTESRQILGLSKQQDYLLARKGRNELETAMNNLKYMPQDEELYNSIRDTTREFIDGLDNTDDLENSVLDVEQYAHDIQNKYGANKLIEGYKGVQDQMTALDKAYEEGKIKDKSYLAYQKARVRDAYEGVQRDEETGDFLPVKIPGAQYTPYVDIADMVGSQMDGWKENGTYTEVRDANGNPTGTVRINRAIPGYLNYQEGTEISAEELYKSAVSYVNSRPDAVNYLQDRAEYETQGIPATAETLKAVLTPEMNKKVFGVENPTIEEIQKEIDGGNVDPKDIIQKIAYNERLNNALDLPVNKLAFRNLKNVNLKDYLTIAALERQADLAQTRQKLAAQSNADVSIHNFRTMQRMNPAEVEVMREEKNNLITQRKEAQAKLIQYNKNLQQGLEGYKPEEATKFNEQVQRLDEQIENIERQEENINRINEEVFTEAGLDIDTLYTDYVQEVLEFNEGIQENSVGGIGRLFEGLEENVANTLREYFTGEDGKVDWEKYKGEVQRANTLSKEEFRERIYSAYTQDKAVDLKADLDKKLKTADLSNRLSVTGSMLKQAFELPPLTTNKTKRTIENVIAKIEETKGKFEEQDMTRDVSYIMVNGDTTKDSLRAYNNYVDGVQRTLQDNFETYKVGDVLLPQYLEEAYGIDDMDAYIDWTQTKITPALERDRKNGQLYNISLAFTNEGKEEANGDLKDVFKLGPKLKLNATYHGANKATQDSHLQDVLVRAFSDMHNNLGAYNSDVVREAGQMYLNSDPAGKALDDLNLYVLSAGGEAKWSVEDGQDLYIKAYDAGEGNSLLDVDFTTEKEIGGKRYVMAYELDENGNQKSNATWIEKDKYNTDLANTNNGIQSSRKYREVLYESPTDIKKVFGGALLQKRYEQNKRLREQQQGIQNATNPYMEYLQSGYRVDSSNDFKTETYESYRRSLKTSYKTPSNIKLTDNKGKAVFFESNVPSEDLVDLRTDYASNIATGTRFPYVHKNAYTYVKSLIDNYGITATGGFRGTTTHNHLSGADPNSPHEYGLGLDVRKDEAGMKAYEELKANPALMAQYGIARLLEESDHIHYEFINQAV